LTRARLLWIGALVLGAAAATAWLVSSSSAAADAARTNIVLVVLDTVRADRLSCYGHERQTTPALDALARRGVRFQHAQSVAPWTIPSMASLWTGVLPSVHRAGILKEPKAFDGKGSFRGFDEGALPSLPRRLEGRGYRNFAFVANPVLERMSCFLGGFERGFCRVAVAKAETAVAHVTKWLPELEESEPFFLYVHLMDAHQPLNPPRQYRDMFVTDGSPRDERKYAFWGELDQPEDMRDPGIPAFREEKLAVYDGALRYMDDELGKLFARLESRGLLANTLVVVTADHGEEFWDHGVEQTELYDCDARANTGVGHGQTQFQELLSVPLIVAGPGIPPGEVETRVSLLDLGATLFDLALGERAPDFGESRSFGALVRGESLPGRPAVSEETSVGYELKALVRPDGMKYVMAHHAGEKDSLFDLAADPLERRDLTAERPDAAASLKAELTGIVEAARAARVGPGARSTTSTDRLEELGYAGDAPRKQKSRRVPQRISLKGRR
jgi:arylsulfatase A-like enzyme